MGFLKASYITKPRNLLIANALYPCMNDTHPHLIEADGLSMHYRIGERAVHVLRLDMNPWGLYWSSALTATVVSGVSLGLGARYLLAHMRLNPAMLLRSGG